MGARSPKLAECRADLRELARWLQVNGRNPGAYHWWRELNPYYQTPSAETLADAAGELLRGIAGARCSCGRVPHRDSCAIMRGLDWTIRLHDRWSLTRQSNSANVPRKLKGETDENDMASDDGGVRVIPFRRRAAGG